jgi:hypothetical protein
VEPDRPRLVGRRRSTAMRQSLGADDLFGVRSPCGFLTERRGHCVIDERAAPASRSALGTCGAASARVTQPPMRRFPPTSKSKRHPHARRGSWRG